MKLLLTVFLFVSVLSYGQTFKTIYSESIVNNIAAFSELDFTVTEVSFNEDNNLLIELSRFDENGEWIVFDLVYDTDDNLRSANVLTTSAKWYKTFYETCELEGMYSYPEEELEDYAYAIFEDKNQGVMTIFFRTPEGSPYSIVSSIVEGEK